MGQQGLPWYMQQQNLGGLPGLFRGWGPNPFQQPGQGTPVMGQPNQGPPQGTPILGQVPPGQIQTQAPHQFAPGMPMQPPHQIQGGGGGGQGTLTGGNPGNAP